MWKEIDTELAIAIQPFGQGAYGKKHSHKDHFPTLVAKKIGRANWARRPIAVKSL